MKRNDYSLTRIMWLYEYQLARMNGERDGTKFKNPSSKLLLKAVSYAYGWATYVKHNNKPGRILSLLAQKRAEARRKAWCEANNVYYMPPGQMMYFNCRCTMRPIIEPKP
jgi:hypothetical protein